MPILFAWHQAAHALVDPEPGDVYRDRARAVWAHPTFLRQLALALEVQYADREASPWPEAQLYSGGFVLDADVAACRRFHEIEWKFREHHATWHIRDPRLRSLALRQIFLNAPEALSPEAWRRGQDWMRHRLTTEDEVPWLTIPKALTRCDELAATIEPGSLAALDEIRAWLLQRRDALPQGVEDIPVLAAS